MGIYQYDPISGSMLPVAGSSNHLKDGMFANYETSSTSAHDYAVDDQFMYGNKLYTATQAIAAGGTISPNTNCVESDNITTQISEAGSNFLGSVSKWNALSVAEKTKYKTADIYETPDEEIGLKFSSDGPFTLSVTHPTWDGTLEYSLDKGDNWATWDGSELSGTASQAVYLRGTNNTEIIGGWEGDNHFVFTGKYCTGNVEMLLDYQTVISGQHPTMTEYCYSSMFYNCGSLVTAPQLLATRLTNGCYSGMFSNCVSLINAPELPATTLTYGCYSGMFSDCTSLIVSPQLPAITLADGCYSSMFSGCTSLTSSPELSATSLAYSSYAYMFENTSLISLPELPATSLEESCYAGMFNNCSSLKLSTTQTGVYQYPYRIPTNGTGVIAEDSLAYMFEDTGGTFTGTPTINTIYYTDHEPVGDTHTVLHTITYKANGGTGSDVVVPQAEGDTYTIASNTFTKSGYTFVKWNTATDGSGIDYEVGDSYTFDVDLTLYAIWEPAALKFSSDGNFALSTTPGWNGTIEYSKNDGDTWTTWNGGQLDGTANQPILLRGSNNSVIMGAEIHGYWNFSGKYITGNIETLLDYQTVVNGQHPIMGSCCYNNMFEDCTSLISIPKLPATTLTESCYQSMFNGCTSLKLSVSKTGIYQYAYRIPTSGTGTTATEALYNMFANTGGTFTGTPTINTTYYTDHEPI